LLQDLSHISWPLGRDAVPENIAPVAKPLPTPGEEVKDVGGGFVEAYGTSGADRRTAKGKERAHKDFEQAQMYRYRGQKRNEQHLPQGNLWHEHLDFSMPSIIGPKIQAPQPVYTHVTYGRFTSTLNPTLAMYGEDTKTADTWDKIEPQ
jgi:hypothetical protein